MKTTINILSMIFLFIVYMTCRIIKSPMWWTVTPKFFAWNTWEDGKQRNVDFVIFLNVCAGVVWCWILTYFMPFWMTVTFTAIISFAISALIWYLAYRKSK